MRKLLTKTKMTKKELSLMDKYAAIKADMATLQEELDILEPKIINEMKSDTIQLEYGTFSKVYRKTWKYTSEYDGRKEQYDTVLKQMREDEQNSGEAKATEKVGLSYRKYEPKNQKES